jgi:DNA-binding NarL/FixJ family response regulator
MDNSNNGSRNSYPSRLRIEHKKKHGECLGRVSKVAEKKLSWILRLAGEGYKYRQIGAAVGLSRTAVAKHIKQALADDAA